jgi:hypothetical protein
VDTPLSAVEVKNPPTDDAPETDASLIAVNAFDTFSIVFYYQSSYIMIR